MADVKISTLLVRSEMDSSKYAAGAQQKVAADQSMIKSGNDVKVSVTDTQVKISQAGDVLSRLSRQYVDGFAAAQKFTTALNQLSNGVERGKVNMQQAEAIMDGIVQKYNMMGDASQFASRGQVEFAAALDRSNAKLKEQQFWHQEWLREFNKQPIQRNPVANNQNTLGAFGAFNTGQQLQDIAITAAMGQSIPTIALQQGLQLGTALEIQLENAKRAGVGMATALRGAFLGIISPVNLLAIGLTGVAAAAIQFFTSGSNEAKTMNDFLEEQRDILHSMGPEYDAIAEKRRRAFFTPESEAVGNQMMDVNRGNAANLTRAEISRAFRQMRPSMGIIGTALEAAGVDFSNSNFGRGMLGNLGLTAEFRPFQQIVIEVERGSKSILEARQEVQAMGEANRDLIPLVNRFLELTAAAAGTAQEFQTLTEKQDRLKQGPNFDVGSLFPRMHPEAQLGRNPAELQVEQIRRAAELAAELQQINARTIEERVAAARAMEEARDIPGELQAERVERANTAATLERARAERELADARRDRRFGREDLIAQGQLDLSTVGQTGGEIARMRKEFELMQELREESRRTGVPVNEAEAAAVRETAQAYGELTQAITKKQLASDLAFERSVAGLNAEDEAIARRLHSLGLAVDLNGPEAQMMRQIDAIDRMKETWQDLFDTINDGIDNVVDALWEGQDPMEALKQSARDLLKEIFNLAITNPLKNFLTGANENTIADMGIFGAGASSGRGGGFGGLLGGMFGLDKTIGAMSVTAGTVVVNGGIAGGAGGGILGALGLGGSGGAANDNLTTGGGVQDYIQKRISDAFGDTLTGGSGTDTLLGGSISRYASAIKAVESSGNYGALGSILKSGDRAYGAYQVMGNNVGPWTERWFGQRLTPNQFLKNPAAQDAVFNGEFGSYVDKWGPSRAANAWFTGSPDKVARDINISSTEYVSRFNNALEGSAGRLTNLTEAGSQLTNNFAQLGNGLQNLGGMLSSFMSSSMGGGSSWFQGLMGSFGGIGGAFGFMNSISPAATASIIGAGGGFTGLYHEGGIAGSPSSMRYVHPSAFLGARRYHSGGLAGDEVPAILRRGEPVFRSMDHARQVVGANQNVGAIASQVAKLIQLKPNFIMLDDPQRLGDYVHGDNGNKAIFTEIRRNRMGRDL